MMVPFSGFNIIFQCPLSTNLKVLTPETKYLNNLLQFESFVNPLAEGFTTPTLQI